MKLYDKLKKDQIAATLDGDVIVRDSIRQPKGSYKFNHRTSDLQKFKRFDDQEYEIIGGHRDNDGGVVFDHVTETGHAFSCRPRGTLPMRVAYLKNIDSLDVIVEWIALNIDWTLLKNKMQAVGMVKKHFGPAADGKMVSSLIKDWNV